MYLCVCLSVCLYVSLVLVIDLSRTTMTVDTGERYYEFRRHVNLRSPASMQPHEPRIDHSISSHMKSVDFITNSPFNVKIRFCIHSYLARSSHDSICW